MAVVFSNNAATRLASDLSASATAISVVDGSVFPDVSGGHHTYLTLHDVNDNIEIVKLTGRTNNELTVSRGHDGTTAKAFISGDKCELRITAILLNEVSAQADTDTNTEYTAGSGLNLSGTTFSLTDTNAKLNLSGGTLTGRVTFPTGSTTKPILAEGFLARVTSDTTGTHDIWGISGDFFPSASSAAYQWGIQWSGSPNEINFIGAGQKKLSIDLDTAGNVEIDGNRIWDAGDFTSTNINNWNTAYGWGDHGSAGYLTSHQDISGKLNLSGGTLTGALKVGPKVYEDFESSGHFYLGNNDWSSLIGGSGNGYSATHKGMSFNSGSGTIPCLIPIDPEATYRIKIRFKQVTVNSGAGKFYFGVNTLNEDKSGLFSDVATSYNYGVVIGQSHSAGSTYTYEDTFSGYNATNAGDHQKFDPEGKYFNLVWIANYQGSGEVVIQSIEVQRLPDSVWVGDSKVIDSSRNLTNIGTISSGVITATGGNSGQWNTAYGWGNHASAGYLTSYTDTNTTYSAGTGVTLTGTTFSLTDTNSKLNLSGGTLTGKISMSENNEIFGLSGAIANYPRLSFNSSEGTHTAKTQTLTGDLIGQIDFNPYTGSSYTGGGKVSFISTENITSTQRGTEARIYSTKTGQAALSYHQFKDDDLYIKDVDGATYKYWHADNGGGGSGLDADLLDGVHATGFTRFYNNAVLQSSGSTGNFIAELISDYGCFQNNSVTLKIQWSYAGSSDLVTGHATIGTIELAGCTIETWGGTYKHIRITRPNTGTGGHMVVEYNDQSSSYAPAWREIWTSESDGPNSGLDADLLDGQQGSYYYPASNPNGYTSNVGDITGVTAGTGLTGGGTSGTPTLNVIGGDGITANANDIAVDSTVLTTSSSAQVKAGVLNTRNNTVDDETLFAITDSDTSESIRAKFYSTSTAFTKVDDATAPASGVFKVQGSESPTWGEYIPIDDETEIIFECWIKHVSGSDTSGNFYAGGQFYNGSKSSYGNTQRYWGANGDVHDSDTPNPSRWRHIKGVMHGGAIRSQSTTPDAQYVRLLTLFNYSASGNASHFCGFRFYRSKKTISSLWLRTHNTTSYNQDSAWQNLESSTVTNIVDNSGNITSPAVVTASGGNSGQWNTAYGWGDHASAGYLRSDVSDVYNGRVLEFGTAGNGTNTSGAFLTIEGNTDSSGEGSGRLFFREHNSSTTAADNYGMSLGYRGGSTSVTTARGNTWTGLTAIGNGEWGMWGHDGNQTGVLAMHGPRNGSYVDFNNAKIAGNEVWHAGNDGSGSGLDADLLDGYGSSTSATANTIVRRNASGHIYGNYILGSYFNASHGNSENPTIGQVWTQNTSDNYLRKSTPAHFGASIAPHIPHNDSSSVLQTKTLKVLSSNIGNIAGSSPHYTLHTATNKHVVVEEMTVFFDVTGSGTRPEFMAIGGDLRTSILSEFGTNYGSSNRDAACSVKARELNQPNGSRNNKAFFVASPRDPTATDADVQRQIAGTSGNFRNKIQVHISEPISAGTTGTWYMYVQVKFREFDVQTEMRNATLVATI